MDFISSEEIASNGITTCFKPPDFIDGRPKPELFMLHLEDFLSDNPHGKSCPSAGHPAYGPAVNVLHDYNHSYYNDSDEFVGATHYMGYHTILKTSADFTNALEWVYEFSDTLTEYLQTNSNYSHEIEIFPYRLVFVVCLWVFFIPVSSYLHYLFFKQRNELAPLL